MLNDAAIDGSTKVCVLVCDAPGFVSDAIKNILQTSFAEKVIPSSERHLDNGSELGELLRSVILDSSNSLEVRDELSKIDRDYQVFCRLQDPNSILLVLRWLSRQQSVRLVHQKVSGRLGPCFLR